jgi:hypothetical protein
MEPLNTTSIAALAFFGVGVLLACALITAPLIWYYLYHRRRIAEIKGTHAQQLSALQERVERVESKCAAMQEQITDAHMLLVDERRVLDKKLAESFPEILPPMPPIPEEPSASGKQRSNRERSRE